MINTKRLYTIEDLEAILDALPCSIYIKDKEGKYIYTNKFAADISALEKDFIIGRTDFDLKDSKEAYRSLKSDKKSLEDGIPVLTEEYGINKTQNTPFSVYKIPLLNSKNVVTVSKPLDINRATNIDFKKITYKKTNIDNQNNYLDFIIEILNNLCTILAACNVNIFLFNSDNSAITSYASSTINENIFYENITIKVDEPLLSKIDNETNSFKHYKYINSILSKYYKKEYTTKNTSSFIVKALCFANKVIGILHINYDNITKYQINNEGLIKDICDNLSSLLVSFNVTNEFEMNYFATLSHEFKTPINIILSSIQLLLKLLSDNCEIDNDTLLKYLNILKQNSYRLLRLVNNVLDSSKLENNFTDLTLSNCNIINIIENIVLSTCDYLEQNNKEIIFDTDEEEVFLSCDPDKIEKVMLNLISNSLKFTDDNGKIKVKIITDYESKKLFVHVQNNGPEISVSDSKKIFSRFIQSDELFTKKNQGTGIGLFLCKSFIELHDGEIWANPSFKNGAEFIFYLPIKLTNSEKFDISSPSIPSSKIEKCNIEFSDIYSI